MIFKGLVRNFGTNGVVFFDFFEHFIAGFETAAASVVFDAVADDVDEGKTRPFDGLGEALLEVFEVENGGASEKVLGVAHEDSLGIDGRVGVALRSGESGDFESGFGGNLATGESVNFIVVAEGGEVGVAAGCVDEMVSADAEEIAVTGEYEDVKFGLGVFEAFGDG